MAFTLLKPSGIDLSQTFAFTGSVTGAGGGKCLQVVHSSTDFDSTSSPNLELFSASITPSATSSKILITFLEGKIYSLKV